MRNPEYFLSDKLHLIQYLNKKLIMKRILMGLFSAIFIVNLILFIKKLLKHY